MCPTYFSAFNIEPKAPDRFFNYYNPDTTTSPVVRKDTVRNIHGLYAFEKGEEPVNERMFESSGKNANGLMNKKGKFWRKLFPKKSQNFMKYVKAEITISELDSLGAAEMYYIPDPLFNPDRFKRDQYIYMELFGFAILDSVDSANQARAELLAEDSLAGLSKKQRRKVLRKQRKAERKEKKRLRKEGISSEKSENTKSSDKPDWLDEFEDVGKEEKKTDEPTKKRRIKRSKPLLKGGKKKNKEKKEKPKKEEKSDDPPPDDGS